MAAPPAAAIDLQGHRGARGLFPENTLPAFAAALAIGVSTLELDTVVTADDVLVVSHDQLLNPDITRAGGEWLQRNAATAIHTLRYEELSRYDVGRIDPRSAYARRFPRQQSVDGTTIPKLAEVFSLARQANNDVVRFNIETKISPEHPDHTQSPEHFAKLLIAEISAAGLQSRSTIQSFDWRILDIVHREAAEIATVHLSAQRNWMDNISAGTPASPWTAGLHVSSHGGSVPHLVQAAGGKIWSPCFDDLTADSLREARALGLRVIVWTVNEDDGIRRMLALGVDGIISDHPDRLRELAAQAGFRLPPATPLLP
jgi:glycerophosphoryl diester phosphodiesterase